MLSKRIFCISALFLLAGAFLQITGCKKDPDHTAVANVMLVHMVSGVSKVDFYAGDQLLEAGIGYGGHSAYHYISKKGAEGFNVQIKDAATGAVIANIPDAGWSNGDLFSLVLGGTRDELVHGNFADNYSTPEPGKIKIRYMNFAKDVPHLDVFMNTHILAKDKAYYGNDYQNSTTGYIDMIAEVTHVVVREHTNLDTLTAPYIHFEEGNVYTLYTKGIYQNKEDSVSVFFIQHNQ